MGALKRYRVAEASMEPALHAGDGLIAVRLRRPRVGRLVVLPQPDRPERWMVKRVAGVAGDVVESDGRSWPVGPDEMFVLSDNTEVTRADSRTFGPMPVSGAYRVILRVPARWRGRG